MGSGRVPERWESGRVPERWDPGEYRKSVIRVSTENVGSGRVPEKDLSEYQKGGIRVSTGKGSG